MVSSIFRKMKEAAHEALRDKSLDIDNAQSYRTDTGAIVNKFGDQEHINMVDSTCIDSVHYDKKRKEATIKFRNGDGTGYVFPNVPEEVIKGMHGAPSKGRYYHRNIKQYSARR